MHITSGYNLSEKVLSNYVNDTTLPDSFLNPHYSNDFPGDIQIKQIKQDTFVPRTKDSDKSYFDRICAEIHKKFKKTMTYNEVEESVMAMRIQAIVDNQSPKTVITIQSVTNHIKKELTEKKKATDAAKQAEKLKQAEIKAETIAKAKVSKQAGKAEPARIQTKTIAKTKDEARVSEQSEKTKVARRQAVARKRGGTRVDTDQKYKAHYEKAIKNPEAISKKQLKYLQVFAECGFNSKLAAQRLNMEPTYFRKQMVKTYSARISANAIAEAIRLRVFKNPGVSDEEALRFYDRVKPRLPEKDVAFFELRYKENKHVASGELAKKLNIKVLTFGGVLQKIIDKMIYFYDGKKPSHKINFHKRNDTYLTNKLLVEQFIEEARSKKFISENQYQALKSYFADGVSMKNYAIMINASIDAVASRIKKGLANMCKRYK